MCVGNVSCLDSYLTAHLTHVSMNSPVQISFPGVRSQGGTHATLLSGCIGYFGYPFKKWGSMMTLFISLLCACNIKWREPIWCEHYVDPSERRELLLAERADEYLDVVVPHWNTRPKHAGHDAAASHGRSAGDWGTLARHSSESVVAGDTNRKSKPKFFTKEARVL